MKIKLNEHGKKFNSRMLADEIFSHIVEHGDITVDFEGVQEATPSFCHEMFTVLLGRKNKINIINANDSIKLQLNKAMSSIRQPSSE